MQHTLTLHELQAHQWKEHAVGLILYVQYDVQYDVQHDVQNDV